MRDKSDKRTGKAVPSRRLSRLAGLGGRRPGRTGLQQQVRHRGKGIQQAAVALGVQKASIIVLAVQFNQRLAQRAQHFA